MKTKTYDVQIEAIVTKTIRVNAIDHSEAHEIAHELFNVGSGDDEDRYEENTLSIFEVSDEDRNEKPAWEKGNK